MREYKDVKDLMFSIANRIKLRTEDAGDLVNDAWVSGRLHDCPDIGLSRAITQDMLDARRTRDGQKGRAKYLTNLGNQQLEEAVTKGDNDFSYEDKGLLELENKELANKLLFSLDKMSQTVISARISKDKSFISIGKELDMHPKQVERIYHKAIAQMQDSKLIKDLT